MKLPNVRDGVGIMQFTEGYWREQIAKEIEATCECDELSSGWHFQANQMAAIVRGEVKE